MKIDDEVRKNMRKALSDAGITNDENEQEVMDILTDKTTQFSEMVEIMYKSISESIGEEWEDVFIYQLLVAITMNVSSNTDEAMEIARKFYWHMSNIEKAMNTGKFKNFE